MANRVMQQKRFKLIKQRRKNPRSLHASNWSRRMYPAKEVMAEYQQRSKELARPFKFGDMMPGRKAAVLWGGRQPKVVATQIKVANLGRPLVELVVEDFRGTLKQLDKLEIVRGIRRSVCLHFRGMEWIFVEETADYIRFSYPYKNYKHAMSAWNNNEKVLWHPNVIVKGSTTG